MKPGSCSLCRRPDRREIDAAHVAGVTVRQIAKRFDVSPTTVQKHVAQHIAAAVKASADEERQTETGESILDEVESLKNEAKRLQAKAEQKHDVRVYTNFATGAAPMITATSQI